jgi:hypothetical protein
MSFETLNKTLDRFEETLRVQTRELADRVLQLEQRGYVPASEAERGGAMNAIAGARLYKAKDGSRIAVLPREAKYATLATRSSAQEGGESPGFDIAEFVRAAMLGPAEGKAASSTATVPTMVGAQIIDRVRANTVLVQAGARTVTISGPTNIAKITGDPTVYEHTEATADISESDVSLAAVALNPKTLSALVPLSLEVVADSPNLEDVLQASLAAAFALKLDTLGIAAIIAAAGLPVSAAAHDPATWTGTNSAIAAALGVNQNLPKSHISTPANYAARSVILASTAGSWLGKPPHLSDMRELFTSSMTADQALFGDFEAGVAIVVRDDLRLELVRHGKPTSGQHLLVAHLRAAAVPLQVARLFWQKKTP